MPRPQNSKKSKKSRVPNDAAKTRFLKALVSLKDGNFSYRLPAGRGIDGQIAAAINAIAMNNQRVSFEFDRINRRVGKEGKIHERMQVGDLKGERARWIESINALIGDLVWPTSEMARVIGAVAKGDLSQSMSLHINRRPLEGEFLKTSRTVNRMVEQLAAFSLEVTRVAREVGTEGKLGGQALVKGVAGTWKALTDNVNLMASNLTNQVRNIAQVTTAVATGDLSKKITVDVKGEILELKDTINTMVDQLSSFASEVTRVAREVGTEGRLGGQAKVEGVSGTWKDLTDNVNFMANNLTNQVRNIAKVTTAVAKGDLSKKITVDVKGEILELKDTINTMVDQLSSFASEVTRVAREVGTEGKLGGQAQVKGVSGTWKDLTDNVNLMAGNLTSQVRNIAEVTTAVATGDLSKKITVDVKGEILKMKNTINTMVDQLSSFASEVTRVAREVGTEGKLGGQAQVRGVSGTWKDLTDNVNLMAGNLTSQVRNIAKVTTAVATGDLSKKITVDVKGEILELKDTINTMVDRLSSFASEVTRVAREVGTEGMLGGQAEVKGVSGTWKNLTANVNSMANNLTNQVRNIAKVTTAVAKGDLTKKITVNVKGEILELKDTINTMVDRLSSFASEVTRVAREVGTEGNLGGQAQVKGVSGTWKDLTDNVNLMASNLTNQVRNIAKVTTAVATGDLSKKITVNVKGEILELKNTINTMVDQLSSFASEVTRVAREVGTEGKLGGQAQVKGVSGTWKDLTDNVNFMANNLTNQVRNIAKVTTAVAKGDLSKKITVDVKGEILELKDTINTMVDQLSSFASEVTRVAREVGTEGMLGGQAQVRGVSGTWKDLTDNVNSMANNLTNQVRNIAKVTTAVAMGDLTKKITVNVKGEILELKDTINTMVDQLSSFASEVTRVAREVGTEGMLGGQAQVRGVSGTWKDLTDNVNFMANNLTGQVRGIAKIVTAVARGNLKQQLMLEAKGEIAALVDTINAMIETLATFADQVTTVAREVGVEGKLGGQASVPGASGTWKDLTDNTNQLAANLTTQVRAIAEVATAVTKGDLTRAIAVEAQGEVASLKDNINEMIFNLKDTTQKTKEQDWLKTNLAKFSRMLQGQRDLMAVGKMILSELAPVVSAQQGVFYTVNREDSGESSLALLASYACKPNKKMAEHFELGEGLIGQCALEKEKIVLTNVPDDYVRVSSGLGRSRPVNIVVMPVLFEGDVKAVIELASFDHFSQTHLVFLDQLTESIGIVLNTIEANMRTETLLQQSLSLGKELQSQQGELKRTNEELEDKARLLVKQKAEVETKNQEVELARQALEEKAAQLALTSKYKSEFLANMSHELRTPLNSLLILAQQLSKNPDGNLTPKQTEFSKTIYSSGSDLLALINDILDLSKIESGTVVLDVSQLAFKDIVEYVERTFNHVAESKNLKFAIHGTRDADLPPAITTDSKRLQQILKNLLSNAFKFTERGQVDLQVGLAASGWSRDNIMLNRARAVVAFSVRDTGIGINKEKQQQIFEAFQQADGTTSRKYGGTGLGLSISREIARLLGGEICLESAPGEGSTFTLYLPLAYRSLMAVRTEAITIPDDMKLQAPSKPALISTPKREEIAPEIIRDDRGKIGPTDKVALIVDDNETQARLIADKARKKGFKALVSSRGDPALAVVREFRPHAVVLGAVADVVDWKFLDRMKNDLETRHIPVCVVSSDKDKERALRQGALVHLPKSADKKALDEAIGRLKTFVDAPLKNIFVVSHDGGGNGNGSKDFEGLADGSGVGVTTMSGDSEILASLKKKRPDCVVLDMDSHAADDATYLKLLHEFKEDAKLSDIPVVLSRSKPWTRKGEDEIRKLSRTLRIAEAPSSDRLLDSTSYFLHRPTNSLTEGQRKVLEKLHQTDAALKGKKILVVDDDIRNIFAVTSLLERHDLKVLSAENGRDAIKILRETPDIDIVLMDIMMPEMDGYETMQEIRKLPEYKSLSIIALTAKAMKEDRDKCIEAGASDFIAKPVDTEVLLSSLRVWLYR